MTLSLHAQPLRTCNFSNGTIAKPNCPVVRSLCILYNKDHISIKSSKTQVKHILNCVYGHQAEAQKCFSISRNNISQILEFYKLPSIVD